MNKILELLKKNDYWYENESCFVRGLEKDYEDRYDCDQCGNWNGTWNEGKFSDFVADEVSKAIYDYLHQDRILKKYELTEDADKEKFIVTKYPVDEFIPILINDEDFLNSGYVGSEEINLVIENENYSEAVANLPKNLVENIIRSMLVKA